MKIFNLSIAMMVVLGMGSAPILGMGSALKVAQRTGYYGLTLLPAIAPASSDIYTGGISTLYYNQIEENGHTRLFNSINTIDLAKHPEAQALIKKELGSDAFVTLHEGDLYSLSAEIMVPKTLADLLSQKKEASDNLETIIMNGSLSQKDMKAYELTIEACDYQIQRIASMLHHEKSHITNNDPFYKGCLRTVIPFAVIGAQALFTKKIGPNSQFKKLKLFGWRKGLLHGYINHMIGYHICFAYERFFEARADEAVPNTKYHLEGAIEYLAQIAQINTSFLSAADPIHPPISKRIARFEERLAKVQALKEQR